MSKGLTWTTGKVKLADLVDYEKNPVHISERALKELAKSLQKYGHIIPYTAAAPKNGSKVPILDGHQRKRAEIEVLGIDPKTVVEVRYPSRKLSEKERQEIIVRLRKNTGEFDFDKLEEFFDQADLLEWGFTEKELTAGGFELADESRDAEPQTDRAAELLKVWKVKPGDLWQIGDHRLICGDCTDAATVDKISGEEIGAVIADPPYGVDAVANSPRLQELGYTQFEGDKDTDIARRAFGIYSLISDVQVWFGANYYTECLPVSSGWIVWDKDHHGMDFADAELAWTNANCPIRVFRHAWSGADRDSEKGEKRLHPTQKPAALAQWIIEKYASNDGVIVDPFAGAGWVLVACQNLSRRCRAVEISRAYVAVALQRMADAFPELKIERVKDGSKTAK